MTYAQRTRTHRQYWVDFLESQGGTATAGDTLYTLARKSYLAVGGTLGNFEFPPRYWLIRAIYNLTVATLDCCQYPSLHLMEHAITGYGAGDATTTADNSIWLGDPVTDFGFGDPTTGVVFGHT